MSSIGRRLFVRLLKFSLIYLFLMGFPSASFQGEDDFIESKESTGFKVQFGQEDFCYPIIGVYVLPDEEVPIRAGSRSTADRFILSSNSGQIIKSETNAWIWKAPEEPGLYSIHIFRSEKKDSVILNVFVMMPLIRSKNGYLNGYQIGHYPKKPYRNLQDYLPPVGMIEVTQDNEETWLSPHFQLKQFLCKGGGEYPKYVVLKEKLLIKLEAILESLHNHGFECQTLSIMSGYRTPHYNGWIGNVPYSRHIYGGAADIFIDTHPSDGVMDDLNRDSRIDFQDAKILYEHINLLSKIPALNQMEGGLGAYDRTPTHGPFVHIDVRGYRARWRHGGS